MDKNGRRGAPRRVRTCPSRRIDAQRGVCSAAHVPPAEGSTTHGRQRAGRRPHRGADRGARAVGLGLGRHVAGVRRAGARRAAGRRRRPRVHRLRRRHRHPQRRPHARARSSRAIQAAGRALPAHSATPSRSTSRTSRSSSASARSTPAPVPYKGLLVNSGAEAVENAVKIARYATGRQAIVVLRPGVPRPHAAGDDADLEGDAVQEGLRPVRARGLPRARARTRTAASPAPTPSPASRSCSRARSTPPRSRP